MVNPTTQTADTYLKRAYILINIVLCIPVFLWPLPILIFENPMLVSKLMPTWTICVAVWLLIAVSMDSMLYRVLSFKQAIDSALWVSLFAILIISTLQKYESAWIFGVLFALHSIRAAIHLLKANRSAKDW